MTLDQITEIFKWMTIINLGLFLLSVILIIALKSVVGRLHARFFGISEGQVHAVTYGFFGAYKIAILVFNIVPYVALRVVGG